MAVKMNKKAKANEARKNAEAQKAKRKELRMAKGVIGTAAKSGKGKSPVGQAKKKK